MRKLHLLGLFLLSVSYLGAQNPEVAKPATNNHIIESKSLTGFWSHIIPQRQDGEIKIIKTGNYKVINPDNSFYTFVTWPTGTTVGLYGTYQITSDSTYTEQITKNGLVPAMSGTSSQLRYKFIDENTVYIMYNNSGKWVPEIWKRVMLQEPRQN